MLRSALETIAVLIYLNQLTRKVLESKLSFHEFGDKTSRMLLGSRNQSTGHVSINIVTVLAKCRNRYPLIEQLYAELSESAHPNYEGMSVGYSTIDRNEHSVSFSNKLMHMYGSRHVDLIGLCLTTFLAEYDEEWPAAFEELERWIAENDVMLEATKNSKLEGGDEPHRT